MDQRPVLISCWIQGDRPTAAEAKSLARTAFDVLFDDPASSFDTFLAQVAAEWAALRPPPDAGAKQKKQWDSFSKTVVAEFQRFLERVLKLKETPAVPEQRVAAEPTVVRFVVDRLTDAIVGLQNKAKPLVRGKDAHKAKAQASQKDGEKRGEPPSRERHLEAAELFLRVLSLDGGVESASCDRLLGEIEGRMRERTAAKGRLTVARPPQRSESEELRLELTLVKRQLDDLQGRTEMTRRSSAIRFRI